MVTTGEGPVEVNLASIVSLAALGALTKIQAFPVDGSCRGC